MKQFSDKFFYMWFGFCAIVSLAIIGVILFVGYKVLNHFGIL